MWIAACAPLYAHLWRRRGVRGPVPLARPPGIATQDDISYKLLWRSANFNQAHNYCGTLCLHVSVVNQLENDVVIQPLEGDQGLGQRGFGYVTP